MHYYAQHHRQTDRQRRQYYANSRSHACMAIGQKSSRCEASEASKQELDTMSAYRLESICSDVISSFLDMVAYC